MNEAEFQVRGIRDPHLAVHATSGRPAWLWANDGTRILWANPAGAAIFGADNSSALANRTFGPADQHRRQIARLAGRLSLSGAPRLERLRGFGMSLGQLLTCACTRLVFTGGGIGVLVVALEAVGKTQPFELRLQHLVDDFDAAAIAFTPTGLPTAANAAAMALLSSAPLAAAGLAPLGLDQAGQDALRGGHATAETSLGHVTLDRVGLASELALIAIIAPLPAENTEPEAEPAEGATEQAEPPFQTQERAAEPMPVAPPPAAAAASAPPADEPTAGHTVAEPTTAPAPASIIRPLESLPTPLAASPAPIAPAADAAAALPACDSSALHQAPLTDIGPEPDHSSAAATNVVPTPEPADTASSKAVRGAVEEAQHPLPPEAPRFTEPSPPDSDAVAHNEQSPPPPAIIAPLPESSAPELSSTPPPAIQPSYEPLPPEPPLVPRRHPLRFMWQMDAENRFALASDEFSRLIGPRTATAFGRPWSEIAETFHLDPYGRVAAAIATHDTWSGIVVAWPADGGGTPLPVELSGLPVFDRNRQFEGYRGFGVCRDLDALARLAELRRQDTLLPAQPLHAPPQAPSAGEAPQPVDTHMPSGDTPPPPHDAGSPVPSTEANKPVDTPPNVVPFRPATDLKTPTLTPVENNAFNELARQLAARLESERRDLDARDDAHEAPSIAPDELSSVPDEPGPATAEAHASGLPHGEARRDTLLYDLMPVGVLIYRHNRPLYANKAFLARVGYADLPALMGAGGLDALHVEPGAGDGVSSPEQGAPVTIAATGCNELPAEARLHPITWNGDDAHALIFTAAAMPPAPQPLAPPVAPAAQVDPTPATSLEAELGTILDATDDGILIFDQDGNVVTCNRGAEVMFGYGDRDIVRCHLTDLFAPDDRDLVRKAIDTARGTTGQISASARGRTRSGEIVPLRLTLGRSTANGERLFAIGRREAVVPEAPKAADAPQQPDRAAHARADILARISHEVRTPLNAVIGFADVMIEERFGALGNERYAAYLKDIRAAGERVLAIITDMLDLSRAETGKLDLTFARHDLNDLVEKCVTIMQPQANRERIIIRTSLAHALPPVTADAGALRQIVLNLVGNSIHVARAGGQIIVSTALTDLGDVVLRIRDSGRGFAHGDGEATTEPSRAAAEQVAQDNIGINLSLTKALVEANQGQFHIKATPQAGTLVEVAFTPKAARAV
ncbi:PAS domain S-box protein [Bradyrhizobium sp. U87765 SZCCT0131]|nr:PAS domain S-box protein [Bradyrhizobium sp. U87765 SZCCT0131]MBR1265607.1 PAS domain S-box protein [Bradyrhizobium sp. U87765 SZCCT0134]MBR1304132.1 PAS domain S-box protein [Bradyrhizobium sp. U87765 SZCCT0110]MBR1319738.1 PAS domain S-box protein [Bradyrhizobium sp. U87765 SZCCT0109]MBR1348063.1 PAS domain S-box protein [Bradyrhizobium sp. U87765 SZCCT0048]